MKETPAAGSVETQKDATGKKSPKKSPGTHLMGGRERPPQLWRPQQMRSPRPQVKAQGRSQESKKSWRKKEPLRWGKKTQDRLLKSLRPSSSLLLVNLRKKLPVPPKSGPQNSKYPSQPKIRNSTSRKLIRAIQRACKKYLGPDPRCNC